MSKLRTGAIFTQEVLVEVTKAVEGAQPRTDQPDAVFKHKIKALQRFLQHGMSRFSVETLQYVLSSLVQHNGELGDPDDNICSLREVRAVVKKVILRKETGRFGTGVVDSLHYMELFFFCVYCLSEARRLFQLVFQDLYSSYYDPNHISRQNTMISASPSSDDMKTRHTEGHSSQPKDYARFGISTLEQLTGTRHNKLKHTVEDLRMVLHRWTQLLTEDVPNPQSFDPESEQDLVRLHDVASMESVLRLVPDMFAKYYKCLELAKQWWVLAHELYSDLPFERRSPASDGSDRDSGNLSGVTSAEPPGDDTNPVLHLDNRDEVDEVTKTLEVINDLHDEIDVLEKREEKFEVLMETYNKVGRDIERLKSRRHQLLLDQEVVKINGTLEEIAGRETEINVNDSNMRLLEFQQALLFEDYAIHLELRPSIIRFLHNAKSQLNEAEQSLNTIQTNHDVKEAEQTVENTGQKVKQMKTAEQKVTEKFERTGIVESPPYKSEYTLQSIERGVKAISKKCKDISHDKSGKGVRKQSFNRVNSKQRRLSKDSRNESPLSKNDTPQRKISLGSQEKKSKTIPNDDRTIGKSKDCDDKNDNNMCGGDKRRVMKQIVGKDNMKLQDGGNNSDVKKQCDRSRRDASGPMNKNITMDQNNRTNVSNKERVLVEKSGDKLSRNGRAVANKSESVLKTDKSHPRGIRTRSDSVNSESMGDAESSAVGQKVKRNVNSSESDISLKTKNQELPDTGMHRRKYWPHVTSNNSNRPHVEHSKGKPSKQGNETAQADAVESLPKRNISDKSLPTIAPKTSVKNMKEMPKPSISTTGKPELKPKPPKGRGIDKSGL